MKLTESESIEVVVLCDEIGNNRFGICGGKKNRDLGIFGCFMSNKSEQGTRVNGEIIGEKQKPFWQITKSIFLKLINLCGLRNRL